MVRRPPRLRCEQARGRCLPVHLRSAGSWSRSLAEARTAPPFRSHHQAAMFGFHHCRRLDSDGGSGRTAPMQGSSATAVCLSSRRTVVSSESLSPNGRHAAQVVRYQRRNNVPLIRPARRLRAPTDGICATANDDALEGGGPCGRLFRPRFVSTCSYAVCHAYSRSLGKVAGGGDTGFLESRRRCYLGWFLAAPLSRCCSSRSTRF